jgi:hypothetical protein
MILEVPLAMMAWVSVVLIQALVHFGMFGSRRDQNLAPLGDGGDDDDDVTGQQGRDSYQLDHDGIVDDEDDEGPPEGLETLLSQTGDDVISVSTKSMYTECPPKLVIRTEQLECHPNRGCIQCAYPTLQLTHLVSSLL